MPVEEGVDAVVELVGGVAVHVEVGAGAPADVRVGVVVREPHRAAAGKDRAGRQRRHQPQGALHQKLSTVMCPGLRRRCLRRPRAISAAVVSFSMSGLPHSMTCEVSASGSPAAASSRPSASAAGMRPASDPGDASRLTKVTYLRFLNWPIISRYTSSRACLTACTRTTLR